jgi:UDP-glucose 4-epimerase
MKHYLVTGGAGFIGSHLVDRLIQEGNKVTVIDNLSSGKKEYVNAKARFHQVDICDTQKMKPLFSGVDGVFHLAAIPKVSFSVEDPVQTSKVNILGAITVFTLALEAKVKRVVFASSAAVYGNQNASFVETMEARPMSPYGLQKLTVEQFARLFAQLYGIEIICLRYFNVYGPRLDFGSDYSLVAGKFLRLALENKPLPMYGNGKQTRSFCYVDDVVDASIKAVKSSKIKGGQAINIGHEKSYTINYLADLVGGKKQYFAKRAGDLFNAKADVRLARRVLGWQAKTDLAEGLGLTKLWLQQNLKTI